MNAESKIGPLPVWVWGVIIGIIGLGWAWYGNSQKTTTTPVRTTGAATADETMWARNTAPAYVDDDATGDVATNLEWLAKSVAAVGDQFGLSRLDVQSALSTYLLGGTLTDRQKDIVSKALAINSLPPEGISGLVNNGVDTYVAPVMTDTDDEDDEDDDDDDDDEDDDDDDDDDDDEDDD